MRKGIKNKVKERKEKRQRIPNLMKRGREENRLKGKRKKEGKTKHLNLMKGGIDEKNRKKRKEKEKGKRQRIHT